MMSFLTDFTPSTDLAISSARILSVADGVKPDNCTTPFLVSTPMAVMRTDLSSACLALMFAVIEASSRIATRTTFVGLLDRIGRGRGGKASMLATRIDLADFFAMFSSGFRLKLNQESQLHSRHCVCVSMAPMYSSPRTRSVRQNGKACRNRPSALSDQTRHRRAASPRARALCAAAALRRAAFVPDMSYRPLVRCRHRNPPVTHKMQAGFHTVITRTDAKPPTHPPQTSPPGRRRPGRDRSWHRPFRLEFAPPPRIRDQRSSRNGRSASTAPFRPSVEPPSQPHGKRSNWPTRRAARPRTWPG